MTGAGEGAQVPGADQQLFECAMTGAVLVCVLPWTAAAIDVNWPRARRRRAS
jgi:hypothetical protein